MIETIYRGMARMLAENSLHLAETKERVRLLYQTHRRGFAIV